MAQIKIYSLKENLDVIKVELSTIIHECVVNTRLSKGEEILSDYDVDV